MQDRRTPAEHSCDRILYSDAFRRLGGVTQVVAVGETPLFHTRLTHTLKVQQLARRIAEHIDRSDLRDGLAAVGGIDVAATEAAGLAHDLGHPPFGHIAEEVLDQKCVEAGLDGFEGNAQTFRVLTKLAQHRPGRRGLELDPRTLNAVLKYPWMRTKSHESDRKWGAYATEVDDFRAARSNSSGDDQSVEAAAMDWADDITYAVHDLEDFIRAGRIPVSTLVNDDVERNEFTERAAQRVATRVPGLAAGSIMDDFSTVFGTLFNQFTRYRGRETDLAELSRVCGILINQYVTAVDIKADQPCPLHVEPGVRAQVEMFKQLVWHYVIDDPRLATVQQGQKRVVRHLFDRLLGWLRHEDEHGDRGRVPARLRELHDLTRYEDGCEAYPNPQARRGRAVADYISSLTEDQAIDLHERLIGHGRHSALDPWMAY